MADWLPTSPSTESAHFSLSGPAFPFQGQLIMKGHVKALNEGLDPTLELEGQQHWSLWVLPHPFFLFLSFDFLSSQGHVCPGQ